MSSYNATVAAYAAVLVLGVVAELVALTAPRLWAGFGQVLTWALRRRSTQLGLVLAWWWLGWHWATGR
jgi:Family of unknown function (DUF6186)